MLKGAQKRMVMLRTADSSLFETAYFILRDDSEVGVGERSPTMLEEANRILDQSFTPRTATKGKVERPMRRMLRQLPGFLVGLLVGGAVVGLVWMVGMA